MPTPERRTPVEPAVSQISLPNDARVLSTLSRIDYRDAFRVNSSAELSAEQWARAALEDASPAVRARLLLGWTALGLRLGAPWSEQRVLGWKIEHSTPSHLLLTARSWLGLRGQLLFHREPHGLLFATFIQQSNPAARTLWAAITTTHQHTVRSLLTHAARRQAGRSTPTDDRQAPARRATGSRPRERLASTPAAARRA